jgi:pyrroloquinoline quinone (PQQ) biosynthesis protein C
MEHPSAGAALDVVAALDTIVNDLVALLLADHRYGRLCEGTVTREEYLDFLGRTYHYVKETQHQLMGGSRALREKTDAVHVALRKEFDHHAHEETGHEQWVLDDIRAIGGDVEAAIRTEPCLAVRLYVASGQITLASQRPLGILGVGYVLEGISEKLGTRMAVNLVERSGIPNIAKAVSFLASHGDADVGHVAEARSRLRSIDDEDNQEAILLCAKLTAAQYSHILRP